MNLSKISRFTSSLLFQRQRLKTEALWIILTRAAGLAASFVVLKILTNNLSEDQFAEYSLVMSALVLLTAVAIAPMERAYLRYYHTAEEHKLHGAVGRALFTWFAVATVAVLSLAAALSLPLSRLFSISAWTVLAGGLVFLCNRWRFLGIQALNIRRRRRDFALNVIGFHAVHVGIIALIVTCVSASAPAALIAFALAALVFAVIGMRPLVKQVYSAPPDKPTIIYKMVVNFGTPFAALLVFQWLQNFADRYIIAWRLDMTSAGIYVAAYQVCGVPYVFLANLLDAWLKPVAYQRGADVSDPHKLWSSDRILLMGIVFYLLLGGVMLVVYALFGSSLIVLLSSAEYRLPTGAVLTLALGRYVQCIALLLQMFFEVHLAMTRSLVFRLAGAIMTLPAVWLAVDLRPDLFGAALGVLCAVSIYVCLLTFGPNGVLWLILLNRRLIQKPS